MGFQRILFRDFLPKWEFRDVNPSPATKEDEPSNSGSVFLQLVQFVLGFVVRASNDGSEGAEEFY
jgi:hypothetical protein